MPWPVQVAGSSVNAVRIAEELGVDAEIVLYLKTPPDAATLRSITSLGV